MKPHHVYNDVQQDREINLLFAGYQYCGPGYTFKGRRDHYVLHYVVEGEGVVYMHNSKYRLGPGSSFLIFPMQRNKYQASRTKPWKYRWLGFSGTYIKEILESIDITEKHCVFTQKYSAEMDDHYAEIFHLMSSREKGYELKMYSTFYKILWMVAEEKRSRPALKQKMVDYIQTSLRLIEKHYGQTLTVSRIAEMLGINRSYFCQIFKSSLGVSVQDYLITYRMDKAKDLLTHNNYLIDEIAHSVGYHSYITFEKRFKATTGYTPSEFRKSFLVKTTNVVSDSEEPE